MALQDVDHTQTKGAVDGQCHSSDAEAQAESGRGPGAAARGLRGTRVEREGGADPEPDPAGPDARPGAARRGSRGVGRTALRARRWHERDAAREQSGDGGSGWPAGADPSAAGAQRPGGDPAAELSGAARHRRSGRGVAAAGAVRELAPFLRSLIERGLDLSQGLLVVIDGGKGLRSAVRQVFQKKALVQRCMWHKRENVVSYLPKHEQASWRRRLQHAYDRPTYTEAKAALTKLHRELEGRNQSAAASLAEGLEETLTLHRLGVYELVGVSFKTTNCIESANALVEERCAKVDSWKTSNQRQRWLATALLDIEPRLRRVKGHRHLSKLATALRRALNIKQQQNSMEEAA